MKISVSELIDKKYGGDKKEAAKGGDITYQQIRNLLHQKREVIELADGSYMLDTKKKIVFK